MLAINNKAFLLGQMHRFDEAFAIYEGLQRDGPEHSGDRLESVAAHMMTGNFEAGWRLREARWHSPSARGGLSEFRAEDVARRK